MWEMGKVCVVIEDVGSDFVYTVKKILRYVTNDVVVHGGVFSPVGFDKDGWVISDARWMVWIGRILGGV